MKYSIIVYLIFLLASGIPGPIFLAAQVNFVQLDLPDPLNKLNEGKIASAKEWKEKRRSEIMELFETQVYGKVPAHDIKTSFQVDFVNENALDGQAISKSITATFEMGGQSTSMNIFLYLPKTKQGPYPIFLGLNFYGNHTINADPDIPISSSWARNNTEFCIVDNQADEVSRGVRSSRWPVERIIARGYGLAVIYYGDIDPDFDDGFKNGVHQLLGDKKREKEDWGSLSTWAWGLSRALDYFEQDEGVDAKRVAVIGHSRLGKTSLWAGAQDERFAMVISNDSGCGGAALSMRKSGETVAVINSNFPHWFSENFRQYNDKEETLPIDQHMLISLIAPRPVYVASAQQDTWADPYGEYLSLYYAQPVYQLFGNPSRFTTRQPTVNQPLLSGLLAYHMRTGRHDITRYDWERYMDFADLHLLKP